MLLSLATLKLRLGITNTSDDAKLTTLIQGVGSTFEKHCARILERSSGIEEYDGIRFLALQRAPVESLALYYDIDRAFGADTLLVVNDDYVLDSKNGHVHLRLAPSPSPLCLKAVITGGYIGEGGTVGTGQTALPADLVRLLLQQILQIPRARAL